MNKFVVILNIPRLLPAYLIYRIFRRRKEEVRKFDEDLETWRQWKSVNYLPFFYLFVIYPEFRTVFYKRIGKASLFVKWLCKPLSTCYLITSQVGGGIKIQHGFATIINAEKIGNNCQIMQQVTIGMNNGRRPVLGDNVVVSCGAKVIGGIKIGNNVVIGANAVCCMQRRS